MKQETWICLRGDFQVTQSYWSLQIPALEDIPPILSLEKSGKGMFKLIDNYMYINKELAEAISSILKGPSLIKIARQIENGWNAYIGPYLDASKQIDDIENLNEIPVEGIFKLIAEWQEANIKLLKFHPPSYFTVESLAGALQSFISGMVGEKASDIILTLLSGFSQEAKTYGVDKDFWEIANIVKQDKVSLQTILGKDKTMALTMLNDLEVFKSFIKKHGHLGEVDPYFPKWAETPDKILKLVVNYLTYEIEDPILVYSKKQEERRRITEEIIAKLKKENQKNEFIELLNTTQSLIKLYEYEEHSLVRKGIASLRKLLLNIGKRFASSGKLNTVKDVFFLGYDDIVKLRHEQIIDQLRSLATRRRKWFEVNRMIPARAIITEEIIHEEVLVEAKEKIIKGIGASRGSVSGSAKIIYSQDELWKVKEGEILVVPMTSPEFTPIFYLINGIITDEGGICCHAAIVARELGIPAVVGTRNATKILKDGMNVTIDGEKGIVNFDILE